LIKRSVYIEKVWLVSDKYHTNVSLRM